MAENVEEDIYAVQLQGLQGGEAQHMLPETPTVSKAQLQTSGGRAVKGRQLLVMTFNRSLLLIHVAESDSSVLGRTRYLNRQPLNAPGPHNEAPRWSLIQFMSNCCGQYSITMGG